MLRAMKSCDTFYRQEVRPHSADLCTHVIQESAELLHVRFASGIVDRGGTFRKNRRHDNICRSGDRRFVEQHICTLKVLSFKTVSQQFLVVFKRRAEVHHALKMRIQTPTAYLVSAGFRVCHFAQTRQKRTDEHHRTAEFVAFLEEIRTPKIRRVEVCRREGKFAFCQLLHGHAYRSEQVDEVIDVQDIRQVVYHDRLFSQEHSTKYLQCLVFRALWGDGSMEFMSAFDYKCCHIRYSLLQGEYRCRISL